MDQSQEASRASLVVLFFNHSPFVGAAVRAALSQDYSDLQLIFSDDASSDNTFEEIVAATAGYEGPHTVVVRQNETNLGVTGHVNAITPLLEGRWIFLSGGDDASFRNRVSEGVAVFKSRQGVSAVSFQGKKFSIDSEIAWQRAVVPGEQRCWGVADYVKNPLLHVHGAARGICRDAFTVFGPLNPACPTEDSTLLFRCLLLGKLVDIRTPSVFYRVHGSNLSSQLGLERGLEEILDQQFRDLKTGGEVGLVDMSTFDALASSIRRKGMMRRVRAAGHLGIRGIPRMLAHWFAADFKGRRFIAGELHRTFRRLLGRE